MVPESGLAALLNEKNLMDKSDTVQAIETSKPTILIVDDEQPMLTALKGHYPGYNVLTADNGAQAVALYTKHKGSISSIVMDARMPEMDGFAASKKIHQINSLVPIIMLTAQKGNHDISNVVGHHFHAYIPKGDIDTASTGEAKASFLDRLDSALETACAVYTPIMGDTSFQLVAHPKRPVKINLGHLDPSKTEGLDSDIKVYPLLIGGDKVTTDQAWFHPHTDFSLQYRDDAKQIAELNNSDAPLSAKLKAIEENGWGKAIHSYWYLAGKDETKKAAEAAGRAYHELKKVPMEDRIDFLVRLGEKIVEEKDRWEKVSQQDFHDKRTFAYELEYVKAIMNRKNLEFKARQMQDSVTIDGITSKMIYREPIGAVAINTPPNTGFTMGTNVFADLFLAGVTAVYKPSMGAAAATNELFYFFHDELKQSNMPSGVLNTICGNSEEVVRRLMYSNHIIGIGHIGGSGGGRNIQQEYGDCGKKIVLELNGSDIVGFLDDLTEEEFTVGAKRAFEERVYGASGQFCVGPKRFLVPKKYTDLAVKIAEEVISEARPGLMSDPDTTQIPTSSPADLLKQIGDYKAEGAQIIREGYRVNWQGANDPDGEFVMPSIIVIDNPLDSATFMNEELFGPFIQIAPMDDITQIPVILDKSNYNLRASFHTNDPDSIQYLADNSRVGGISFNVAHNHPYAGYVGGGRGFSCETADRGARNFGTDFTKPVIPRIVSSANPNLVVNSPKEKTSGKEERGIVSITQLSTPNDVNMGYQTPNRVDSYVATQEHIIVPKGPFFERMLDTIKKAMHGKSKISFFEPGIGPAFFVLYLMRNGLTDDFKVEYAGADISHGFCDYDARVLSALHKKLGGKIAVDLTSGVNCADEFHPFYKNLREDGKTFDVILASQFEHYCPNDNRSDLALKYRARGKGFSTKSEFRQMCYNLLNPGGLYFTIDDRLGENQEDHARICRAWDSFVIKQSADPGVLSQIEKLNPNLASKLRKNYDPEAGMDHLLKMAAKTREHRRYVCDEEIEKVSTTKSDLINIFGERNMGLMWHPFKDTHPGFYLAYAIKR
ncbi:MAG: aldehyde dehydrogenase family protein [Nanoarchaeota archaeon]